MYGRGKSKETNRASSRPLTPSCLPCVCCVVPCCFPPLETFFVCSKNVIRHHSRVFTIMLVNYRLSATHLPRTGKCGCLLLLSGEYQDPANSEYARALRRCSQRHVPRPSHNRG